VNSLWRHIIVLVFAINPHYPGYIARCMLKIIRFRMVKVLSTALYRKKLAHKRKDIKFVSWKGFITHSDIAIFVLMSKYNQEYKKFLFPSDGAG
jgi:hypothetical protein